MSARTEFHCKTEVFPDNPWCWEHKEKSRIPSLQGQTGTVISICLSVSQSSSSSFSAFGESFCGFVVIIHFSHSKEKRCNTKYPSQFISKTALTTKLSVQILVCGKARSHYFPQQFALIESNVVMWFLNGPMTSGKPSAKWRLWMMNANFLQAKWFRINSSWRWK